VTQHTLGHCTVQNCCCGLCPLLQLTTSSEAVQTSRNTSDSSHTGLHVCHTTEVCLARGSSGAAGVGGGSSGDAGAVYASVWQHGIGTSRCAPGSPS